MLGAMPEAQKGPAVWGAPPGFHLLHDRVAGEIARQHVFIPLVGTIARCKLLHQPVEQPPAELVAERIPHDWIHPDQSRGEMTDREELHEFHVDERRTTAERQRIAIAAHVRGGAVAL